MHSGRSVILGFERILKKITYMGMYILCQNSNGRPDRVAFTKTSITSILRG